VSATLCHACQQPTGRYVATADGRVWCADFVECNHGARLRLGVPLYQANQLRARERWTYSKAQGGRQ
jgi:hypothetical protein